MELKLYDTLTREKRPFVPLDSRNVRMYVCGPTVYDFAHIGNARPVIVFDVLFRLLRHLYGADHVTYVRNITDVDDKINARAAEEYPDLPLNEAIRKVTEATDAQFQADVTALGCLEPTHQPRATEFVLPRNDRRWDMKSLIQVLLDRENAYVVEGIEGKEILFDVSSMPDYGALSGRKLEDQKAGARVAVDAQKRNPEDFVLWKESGAKQPGWNGEFRPDPKTGYEAEFILSPENASSLGRNSRVITINGRPGWHIECSAMSAAYLGKVFDIHGGGLDLIFPHHENEIAQSRCAFHTPVMANYWMHNGFLQVEGEKMAKSAGNFVTIHDLLHTNGFGGRYWSGEVLRFAMLRTHYRQPIDWTVKALEEADATLARFSNVVDIAEAIDSRRELFVDPPLPDHRLSGELEDALCDDLNTPQMMTHLHQLFQRSNREVASPESSAARTDASLQLWQDMKFLGIDLRAVRRKHEDQKSGSALLRARVTSLIEARATARKLKDFKESDRIRDELAKMGVVLKDTKDGTTWEIAR
jgi:cysteinyl-tRNA synthetase